MKNDDDIDNGNDQNNIVVENRTTISESLNDSSSQTELARSIAKILEVQIEKLIIENQIRKEQEHWVKGYWRPAMGWLYMLICFMDFVGFPLISIFTPVFGKLFGVIIPYQPWTSITLTNGGLIHFAMGAILGVTAWTRGYEKSAFNQSK